MISEYTYSELTDVHIMFARAYGSTLQAQHLYQDDFPGHRVPDRKKFSSTDQRLFSQLQCNYQELTSQNNQPTQLHSTTANSDGILICVG
jgi:hypothetical protein